MSVRRLGSDDLELFRFLRLASLKDAPENYASSYEDWEQRPDEVWLRFLTDEAIFAARDVVGPIGMMGVFQDPKSKMAHRWEMGMVWVDPKARGTGVADALLCEVVEYVRSAAGLQIELSVNATNARAVRFYENRGFEAFGRVPRGYRTDTGFVDDLLMVCMLDV
jgi:ribosomal protein S18 acetylase RimI-like enzyme